MPVRFCDSGLDCACPGRDSPWPRLHNAIREVRDWGTEPDQVQGSIDEKDTRSPKLGVFPPTSSPSGDQQISPLPACPDGGIRCHNAGPDRSLCIISTKLHTTVRPETSKKKSVRMCVCRPLCRAKKTIPQARTRATVRLPPPLSNTVGARVSSHE